MNRLTIALCSAAAGSALALALAVPASADSTGAAAPTAAAPGTRAAPTAPAVHQSALVGARKSPSVVVLNVGPGGALPAANQDGACNSLTNGDGDLCLWFSTNFVGSLSDFFNSDTSFADNTFLTPGLGLGSPVSNNAESTLNADSNLTAIVFTGPGFSGTGGVISPRQFGNFNTTFVNNVESFEWA